MKRLPIVEGDKFKAKSGEVWTVTECLGFGRGYWIISADRCRQTIFNRHNLELMERINNA
jgi:hypothetical protein